MFDATAPRYADLIRLDPALSRQTAEPSAAGAPGGDGTGGFHLIDTTMMYAPKSGGVKRYLMAKRAWLARRRPDVRHTLVVPAPAPAPNPRAW